MQSESITWRSVDDSLPDAERTVLVALLDSDEPVWLGYHDGDQWRDAEGFPVEVSAWAPLPKGPQA